MFAWLVAPSSISAKRAQGLAAQLSGQFGGFHSYGELAISGVLGDSLQRVQTVYPEAR